MQDGIIRLENNYSSVSSFDGTFRFVFSLPLKIERARRIVIIKIPLEGSESHESIEFESKDDSASKTI
jgi:hypothetical protein